MLNASPKRLIVASNRLPSLDPAIPASGGLVVGLLQALSARRGVWFGVSGTPKSRAAGRTSVNDITYVTIDVPAQLFRGYYTEFSNRALWPALHYREDLVRVSADDFAAYLAVNQSFADAIEQETRPDDIIWVHDYHLIPMAHELRQRNVHNPIGLFLHTPFSAPEVLQTIPMFGRLCEMLNEYDLVGLQTTSDVDNCKRALGITLKTRKAAIGHFPIGIDAKELSLVAQQSANSRRQQQFRRSFADIPIIVGVDRLDYSKGAEQRLNAFAAFLKAAPTSRPATLLQISPPSRKEIPEYARLRARIEHLAGEINAAHNEPDWVAIRLVHKSYSRSTLAGIYRSARVGLVTPLRDGMNLVAKEFVACQDPENPGVLILSKFAGAAEQMKESLIVNPHDETEVAEAIARALAMPLEERKERHRALAQGVFTDTAAAWSDAFLTALDEAVWDESAPASAKSGGPALGSSKPASCHTVVTEMMLR